MVQVKNTDRRLSVAVGRGFIAPNAVADIPDDEWNEWLARGAGSQRVVDEKLEILQGPKPKKGGRRGRGKQ